MRIMGLDYGDKTIGVAMSDELKLIAYGLEVIKRRSPNKFDFETQRLNAIISEYKVDKIILGLPKNLNNTLGYQSKKILVFKKYLDQAFKNLNLDIVLWDERLSTVAATKNLVSIGVSIRKQKKIIDKMAAVFILQGYLDYLKSKEDNNIMTFDDDFSNDDKDSVIVMFDEDGNEQELYVLGSVDYNNDKYLIVSENLDLDSDDNDEEDVLVLKEVVHDDKNKDQDSSEEEKLDYHIVDDDNLLDTIISLFEAQLDTDDGEDE